MTRVRIEYFDQNEGFAPCLPKAGRIAKKLRSADVDNWHLIALDEPIAYQLKLAGQFRFENIETNWLLIRSRWQDHEVGEAEPTSVFLLLVRPTQLPLAEPIRIEEYPHVAWGMCHTEQDAAQPSAPADAAERRR